uniref:Uncharacterized protein n=1 Tax=Plectus sambesii TaxID=2011161 RepID=A0A914XPI7_9BILA
MRTGICVGAAEIGELDLNAFSPGHLHRQRQRADNLALEGEASSVSFVVPEGEDELKRKQLMELAIINGTYRPANQSKIAMHTPRLLTPMSLPSPMRSPTLGAPIILSPTRGPGGLAGMQPITPCSSMSAINLTGYGHSNPNSLQQSPLVHGSPSVDYATGQLFINSFDPAFMQSMQQMQAAAAANNGYQQYAAAAAMLGTPFLGADYQQAVDMQAGQLIRHHC